MTASTFLVDDRGWFHVLDLEIGQRPADLLVGRPGWRFARPDEIEAERALVAQRMEHGRRAHLEPLAAVYALAGEIGARGGPLTIDDLDALNVAAVGAMPRQRHAGRRYPVRPACATWPALGTVDVDAELAHLVATANALAATAQPLAAAAFVAWRATWLHPYREGNGRTSRAAAYAILLASMPDLRAAHRRRLQVNGRRWLTVPERMEQARRSYLDLVNAAHARAAVDGHGVELADLHRVPHRRTVDLGPLESYLSRLVADQIAWQASAVEESP